MAAERKGVVATLIERLAERAEAGEGLSIAAIREAAGRRAMGPLLLLPALVVVSPLSIIPGLPTLMGATIVLVAGQIVLGRTAIWLPDWLCEKHLSPATSERLLGFLRPVGRLLDRYSRRRLNLAVSEPVVRVAATVCVLVELIMPLLEFIPFTSTWAGVIVAVFALALTTGDGLLALIWGMVLLGIPLAVAALLG